MLGVEINGSHICLGFRRGKRLAGFERHELPSREGLPQDISAFREIIKGYRAKHRTGRRVMLTVHTEKAVIRLVPMPGADKRSFFAPAPKPDLDGVFPVDEQGHVTGYRRAGEGVALACRFPEGLSLELAGLLKGMGFIPLGLDAYANSVSAALERLGGKAVCLFSGGVICVSGGELREILTPCGSRELGAALDGLGADGLAAYNPAGHAWASGMISAAGIAPGRGYDLGLCGLLGAAAG